MTTLGRISSAIVVLAVLALVLVVEVRPSLMHIGPVHVVDWLGLMIYLAGPVAWLSAIWHWGKHLPPGSPKVPWGLVVVVGFVPGAVVYWLWSLKRPREDAAAESLPPRVG